MIVYSPENIISQRIKEAERILENLPYRYCFITGSFLFKEKYKDIDVFAITRSKKEIKLNRKIKLNILDFNELHSLFYHSVCKMCIAKNVLPKKSPRITISDYWSIINETIPTLMNEKGFHKAIRSLVLYTEYLRNSNMLDSFQLQKKIYSFKNVNQVLGYLSKEAPIAVRNRVKEGYIKRYFYTQAAFHKENLQYIGQKHLYELSHAIAQIA